MTLLPQEYEALYLSLKVAGMATLIGLPIAIALAYLMARKNFIGKAFLNALIHAPLVLPPVIVGYLMLVGLGPNTVVGGFFNDLGLGLAFSWRGAALAALIMALPLMVRAIRLSFENQNPRLTMAARGLGASPVRAFITISLPLALPGILTGTLLGFARALGEFGATITFAANIPGLTQTLPLALFNAVQTPGGEDAAFRLMMTSLLLAFIALGASEYFARRMKGRSHVQI